MEKIARPAVTRPSLDLQAHLDRLAAEGLLLRIDRPIDKDTELHPLVRVAFIGAGPSSDQDARHRGQGKYNPYVFCQTRQPSKFIA